MNIEPEKIQEAKERLGDRNADIIVDLLHPEQYDSRRRVCCCMWPDHDDNHPSMSYNPKTYSFHCFSCGRGDIDIIQAYMMAQGCTFIEACKQLFEAADMPYDFGEQGVHTLGRKYQYPKPKYSKTKDRVYDYWSKRCISPATIDYLDIAEDEEGNTLFQYYDLNDVLVNVKVRLSRQFRKGQDHSKIWHLPGADHVDILYNINRINTTQPLIIASGEGDCAACIECGFPNTVSINGGDQNLHWIGECWDWLSHFEEIILIPDNDESGRKFARDVSTRLGEYRVKTVVIPKFHTKENGEKVSVKDVNELLFYEGKEAVRDAIRDAKDAEIPSVVDYADVKKFDMSDVEGFITHFADLDDALQKFYMGSTTLITGAPGSGKTSFLSTIICQSVEQGFPTFVYSGELSNESLKSWVDFCHAGRFGIAEYDKPYGAGKVYKVRRDAFDAINRTYKGQLFFYKDSIDQKVSNLMSTAESVVRKYGVKTLVFDNMTSVDLENNDDNKWQKQEEFIRDIISFSKRWNVCCIVVLHPKKMDMNRRMSLYDLSGVSASINLSHRVLSLYRVSKKDKQGVRKQNGDWLTKPIDYDVIIDILKDRYGSGGGRDVGLFYDIPSKRFYDSTETLAYQYKWDVRDHSFEDLPYGLSTPDRIHYAENREVFGTIPSGC